MALRVYILGDAATYQNYALAVERAGGISCFESRPADCDCLLLPGGGDMESWPKPPLRRYQTPPHNDGCSGW